MEVFKEYGTIVIAGASSLLCFLFGEITTPILVLIVAMTVDYITGMINGIINKELSSTKGLKGFFKKVVILLLVAFATQVDKIIDSDGLIHNFVLYYYIATEGLSILENAVSIGLPVPDKLKEVLSQLKEKDEG